MDETSITKVLQKPEGFNALQVLYILFPDNIGQALAEIISVICMILRRLCDNYIFVCVLLMIFKMDHTQLQPVNGKPFLL